MTENQDNKPKVQEEIDILALINAGTHYAEKIGDKIHVIDCKTGDVIIMYAAGTPKVPTTLELVVLEDGTKIWTQEALVPSTKNVRRIEFTPIIIDLMCQELLSGKGISDICKLDGFPTYTMFCRWRREHPWIDEALDKARKDRGEVFRDKAIAEADKATSTKDPLGAHSLKVEAYKWAAAVDQPERFSPRAKVETNVASPTQIIIHTGIDRGEKPVVEVNKK